VPVVIHVGTVDPYSTIDLGLHAREIGADAIGIVGPYYFADRSEEELVLHFEMVDRAVRMPILLYNNPRYQGYSISPELMRRFVAVAPSIFGAKLALGTLDDALTFAREIPGFAPFALASVLHEGMPKGVRGTVSPPLTLAPELGGALVRAIDANRDDEARELQSLATELNDTMLGLSKRYGRTPYAEGLRALGFPIKQYPRWPTVSMPEGEREAMLELLRRCRGVPVA
jgi:4-hydroxy-tetrahydrodipicolinate synthase